MHEKVENKDEDSKVLGEAAEAAFLKKAAQEAAAPADGRAASRDNLSDLDG